MWRASWPYGVGFLGAVGLGILLRLAGLGQRLYTVCDFWTKQSPYYKLH